MLQITNKRLADINFISSERDISDFKCILNGVFLKVQQINKINDDIPLEDCEIEYKDKIKSEKRLLFYIKSRKMVKSFISECFSIPFDKIRVFGGVKKSPYSIANDKKISVSISHRGDYIASSLSISSIVTGVDIEKFDDIETSNLSDFLHDFELIDQRHALVCWSIKESFFKMVGRGLTLPSKAVFVSDGLFCDEMIYNLVKDSSIKKIDIFVFKYSDYVVSLCFGLKNS